MSLFSLMSAIQRRFRNHCENALSVPVQYDNSPPASNAPLWIKVEVLPGETMTREFGNGTKEHRTIGVIKINFFAEVGQGIGQLLDAIDVVRPVFSNETSDDVNYKEPSLSNNGRDRGYHQMTLTCPFRYDDRV